MAELADALDSGSSEGSLIQVQVLLPAPKAQNQMILSFFFYKFNALIMPTAMHHYLYVHLQIAFKQTVFYNLLNTSLNTFHKTILKCFVLGVL